MGKFVHHIRALQQQMIITGEIEQARTLRTFRQDIRSRRNRGRRSNCQTGAMPSLWSR